jgi:rhodanese-related sulfurtransferase/predicted transcriptional regulator
VSPRPSKRQAKDALFEAISSMGKALASPRRLELIDLLAQGPRTVEELARATAQSSANTSQHLQSLHAAGVVERHREGNRVRYALAGDDVIELWSVLQAISAHRVAEVERAAREYLGAPVEAVSRDELADRLIDDDLVLVDVRPEAEFEAGHIDGAVSIPIDELAARLAELPEGAEVIAYCRGRFCAYAHEAVRQLRRAGHPARRLEGGWPEWKRARSTGASSSAPTARPASTA